MTTDYEKRFDDTATMMCGGTMKCTGTKGTDHSKSRWLGYAAAGVAGAAMVATGQHADAAKVVNMGNLDLSGGPFTLSKEGDLALDLDDNGTVDVTIINYASSNYSGYPSKGGLAFAKGSLLGAYGKRHGSGGPYNYAANFSRVSSIGPNLPQDFISPEPYASAVPPNTSPTGWDYKLQPGTWYMRDGLTGFPLSGWNSFEGEYANNVSGFLGVRFDIDGATHFGFVEMEVDLSVLNDAGVPANVSKILSYGYEDVADAQISGPGDANFVRNDLTFAEGTGDLLTIETNWFHAKDDVDGADFLQWQRGTSMASPTQRDGDANRDGTVDGQDLTTWKSQFGDARRSPAPALGSVNISAVPEPNSLGLMALGAAGLMSLRRIRRARKKQHDD